MKVCFLPKVGAKKVNFLPKVGAKISALLLRFLPVTLWCDTLEAGEELAEGGLVAEVEGIGYLGNALLGINEHP